MAAPLLPRGDGRFTLAIRARFQADFAGFIAGLSTHPRRLRRSHRPVSSGAVMRRAYFGIEGKAYSDFSYEIRLNAGGTDGGRTHLHQRAVTDHSTGAPARRDATTTAPPPRSSRRAKAIRC